MILTKHPYILYWKSIISILCISFLSATVYGQLQVSSGTQAPYNPESLIRDIFQGTGVQITNVTFNGDTISLGYFDSGLNDLEGPLGQGIDKGFLLSTGNYRDIEGINNQGSSGAAHTLSPAVSDPDLMMLADGALSDVTKIEIEFIPRGDEISFRYVFGSEEYPEWGCPTPDGSFFDAFGLFLSDANVNISGGMGFENDAVNLAVLPNGTPITVESVHPTTADCAGSNEEFYIANDLGEWVELDGFVTAMEAKHEVTPCIPHKLKIVIGDVGRQAGIPSNTNDSVLFLEESSFSSNATEGQRVTFNQNGIIQESCSDGRIQISLPEVLATDYTGSFTVSTEPGHAILGTDYNLSSTGNFVIPAGSTTTNILITPIEDGLIEGPEPFWIAANINSCEPDTFYFTLEDNSAVQPDLGPDVTICAGDSVQLYPAFSPIVSEEQVFRSDTDVAIPDPILNTSTALLEIETVKSVLNVSGAVPDDLGPGVIKSVCFTLVNRRAGDLNVFLRAPGGAFINLTTHNGGDDDGFEDICFVPDPSAELIAQPGIPRPEDPSMLSDPISGNFQPEGNWENLWKNGSSTNGDWELIVYDKGQGPFAIFDKIDYFEITFNAPFDIEYNFNNTNGLSCTDCADPWAKPDVTTTYELTVADNNGCERTDEITITVVDELSVPMPICSSTGPDNLLVSWDRVFGATDYEIDANVLAFPIAGNQADTAHLFQNLDPGQILDITVTPIIPAGSSCNVVSTDFQCQVVECEDVNVTLIDATAPLCNGDATGTINVTANSTLGTDFTYTIQDPFMANGTGNFAGLPAGDYLVRVGINGCFGDLMVTVPVQPAIATTVTKVEDPRCPGVADGKARIEATGGTGDGTYTYLWSNGNNAFAIDDAPAGKIYVTVTDGNGCEAIDSLVFIDPTPIELSTASAQVSCNGAMDGKASVAVMNGIAPYTYLWTGAAGTQMTDTVLNLPGGTYTVFVNDANTCSASATVEILERERIQATVVPIDATCDGIDDGEASVTDVSGGLAPYTFVWNDAAMSTSEMIINVAVGDAIVTVTDSDGCTEVAFASVMSPPAMTSTITSSPVTCSGGSDGGATLDIMGGTGPYMYAWADGGDPINARTDLTSGNNTVTITDANGCRLIETFDVPSQNPIFVSLDSTVVTCFDGNDGGITTIASGGTGSLLFQWDDPSSATSMNLTDLAAGIYRLTVTDANGCFVVDSIEVTQNEKIQLIPSSTAINCNGDGNGTASVTIGNGVTVDSYMWDDPFSQSTPSASNLDGGVYKVIVTYNAICIDSAEISVLEPDVLALSIDKKDIACSGETNGSATANVSGGTAPFQYQWDDVLNQDRATANALSAGPYSVTVTDANGCSEIESTIITEPLALRIDNKESGSVVCANSATGRGLFTPGGGTIPYSYTWSDGLSTDSLRTDLLPQKYFITITDNSGCTILDSLEINNKAEITLVTDSLRVTCFGGDDGNARVIPSGGNGGFMYLWDDPLGQTGSIANTLPAGIYSVTVVDALDCSATTTVEVTQNPRINITGDVMDVTCYQESNGLADASASGGVGMLNYQWDDLGNTMSATLMNVPAGSYLVSVTDELSCVDTLRFNIGEPDSLAVTFTIDGLLCFGDDIGSIQANPSGGNGNEMYQWDDPANQTVQTAIGLMEGLYSLTITDGRGCTVEDTIRLVEPEALTLQLDSTDILCNGAATGAINSTVTGGTLNYAYAYTGGSTVADPSGLTAGLYSLTVTDANGCEIIDEIEINEPTAIVTETMKEDIDCFGNINGAINTSTTGGLMPYEFSWSNGQDIEDLVDLSAGSYTLTVTDGNNCDEITTVTIVSPSELQKTIGKTDVACFGEMTGSASTSVSGGTSPYNYEWSTGSFDQEIMDLSANTYYVTIEDNNGCVTIDSAVIAQPEEGLNAMAMTMDLVCFGEGNGVIDVDVMGGTEPYQYRLDGQTISNSPVFQGLSGGTYDVQVIDQNGCSFTVDEIMVFEPEEIIVDLGENKIIELGIDTVQLLPQVSGGQGVLMYEYSGNNLDNLTCTDCPDPFIQGQVFTKEYILTVTDDAGCTSTDNVIVIISKDRRVWVPTAFTPNADTNNDVLTPLGDPNTIVTNFQIFDRWGTLIYEQSEFRLGDTNIGWDGTFKNKELDTGVFVWKADVVYFEDGVRESFTGQTYLLR